MAPLRPVLRRQGRDLFGRQFGDGLGDQRLAETVVVGDAQVEIDRRADHVAAALDRDQVPVGPLQLGRAAIEVDAPDVVRIDAQIDHVGAGRMPAAAPLAEREALPLGLGRRGF